jgi:hypothetical protein
LVEKQGMGRTPCFATVMLDEPAALAGDILTAGMFDADERTLRGRVVTPAMERATAHA